jgi:hypothetical protein
MAELQWHQPGERRYETGVDRGVLYLSDGTAVPWNGLTSVTEGVSREVKSYFLDGIKYLDHHVPGSFSAKLQAFTYPDELDELLGTSRFAPGVFVHDQRTNLFNLSYRTLVGNDVEGTDHGYKLHILYNILAIPGDLGYETVGESFSALMFEWDLSGTPPQMFGVRPTCHISLHSRSIDSALLEAIEVLLYGSVSADPTLPSMVDLLKLIEEF